MMRAKCGWSRVIARGKAYRTAQTSLFEAYAIENGYRKERLPKCPEFIDRLAEDFPAVLQRFEHDRRVRGITVLPEDWADAPELRECDNYNERSISKALYSLFDE
jgi:hypothetical protein